MMKVAYIFIITIILLVSLMLPSKALAATTPTSVVIDDVWAFTNVFEEDDQLYLVQYTIDYAAPGDAPDWVGEVYLGQFADDTEIFTSTQPWGYFGSASLSWWFGLYVSAAEVTDLGITWQGANNKIAIAGNPALSWSGAIPYTSTTTITYSTATTLLETRADLETRYRIMGLYYENISGGTLDLFEEIGGVLKLTSDGEIYYTSTIGSLRTMAPNIFANSTTSATFNHSELITDYYLDACNGGATIFGANWTAQTFYADYAYDISGTQIRTLRVGNPGNVTVSLRATAAGLPTGADLASGTVSGNDFSTYTTGEWETIAFDDDYTLTGGTTYALVIRATAGDANNYISWRGTENSDYGEGQRCNSVNSGVAWAAAADWDMAYANFSKDGTSPAYSGRSEIRLKESPFDMTDLAGEMGLSTLWASTMFWLAACVAMIFASIRVLDTNRGAWSIFLIMTPIGWYTGFLAPAIAIAVVMVCAIGFVYQFFFKPSGV